MGHEAICPECGSPLLSDAPEGLCPQCLMKLGRRSWLGGQVSGDSDSEKDGHSKPSPPPEDFALPDMAALQAQFPRLEILEILGRGGMGVVYKARQKDLDRLVALKILAPEVARDSSFAERFNREAKALARLNHPHIVTIYDFGVTEAGQYYFVMEYVDGANLRAVIRSGELAPEQALALVPQICEALQFAHDEGIVHRDIKPANILLDKKGRVKIADFGLVKLMRREPDVHSLTADGQTMGTLNYMAPEQLEKPESVDHRADIYSLGVVFYEMLTGELPLGRFMPPSQKVHVDVRLDEVVLRTLEKEPARRYQHASEVKSEVEHISDGYRGKPTKAHETKSRHRAREYLVAGLLIAAVVLAYWGTRQTDTSAHDSRVSTVELKRYPVDSLDGVIARTGLVFDKEISSDGNGSIRIATDGPTTVRLYETGDLDVEDALLTYQARMRTEKVEGKAYLEMWCQFPGGLEFFSKDLESALSGSTEWCTEMTPFFLKQGENPVNVKLNVVIEGKGTVWIDDIRLSKGPLP